MGAFEALTISGHRLCRWYLTVRGTARLSRVVGNDSAFLMAVQRLDRGVSIENPRHIEQPSHALGQVGIQPARSFCFRDAFERVAQHVFGDNLAHAEQSGNSPRRSAFSIPTHLHSTGYRLHTSTRQKHCLAFRQLQFLLTHRVTPLRVTYLTACLSFSQIARHQLSFLGSA